MGKRPPVLDFAEEVLVLPTPRARRQRSIQQGRSGSGRTAAQQDPGSPDRPRSVIADGPSAESQGTPACAGVAPPMSSSNQSAALGQILAEGPIRRFARGTKLLPPPASSPAHRSGGRRKQAQRGVNQPAAGGCCGSRCALEGLGGPSRRLGATPKGWSHVVVAEGHQSASRSCKPRFRRSFPGPLRRLPPPAGRSGPSPFSSQPASGTRAVVDCVIHPESGGNLQDSRLQGPLQRLGAVAGADQDGGAG